MDEVKALEIHDLFSREVRPLKNWHEWLLRWNVAASVEEMLGLLHFGFTMPLQGDWREPKYEEVDRVLFYLKVADGWNDANRLVAKGMRPIEESERYQYGVNANGYPIKKKPSEMRQVVAEKAFELLCFNFFKRDLSHGDHYHWDWKNLVTSAKLYQSLQKFFRLEKSYFGSRLEIRNLSPQSKTSWHQHANRFMLQLVVFVWGWEDRSRQYFHKNEEKEKAAQEDAVVHRRLDGSKPWLIEVLNFMDRLDVVEGMALRLEKPSLERLRYIAMREKITIRGGSGCGSDSRRVKTLDEACYVGSKAAWALKSIELIRRESKRIGEIEEAERIRYQAELRVRELTNS